MGKIIATVQVRMGSKRLRRKALALIGGEPMTWHIVRRLRQAQSLDDVVLAIPAHDAALIKLATARGVPYFPGSERDLVGRLRGAARAFKATAIVRITGDCPLVDHEVVDKIVQFYLNNPEFEYVSNSNPLTYPDGLDVEVYPRATLERLIQETPKESVWRGWFAPYVWEHDFRQHNVEYTPNLSGLRWTVDYAEDLEFVRQVYARLGDDCLMGDVLALLEREPELAQINARETERYHGFAEDERKANELSNR